MDRRNFLRSLFTAAVATELRLVNLDKILKETSHLSDVDFVTYITFHVRMWVHNPAYCGIITNIAEP